MLFQTISTKRLYREIAEQIRERIEAGHFPLGTRLPSERELAESFDVSRSSVREALIALEISGYVDVRMGSGVYVSALLPSSMRLAEELPEDMTVDMSAFELLEARLLIEPECAALAAQHATPEQRAELTQLHQAMKQAHSGAEAGKGPVDYDHMFHQMIAHVCPNAALASACMHLWDLRERSRVFQRLDEHFVTPAIWQIAWNEHMRIVEAICAGDAVRARHAMAYHINAIMARLREDPEGWVT